ncbi:MAG: diaminobutyrate acetyltransferase, partial [Gammaproteobacteria bacterium]|nr:diaminobutyrate acetyltransferase [Gammaproteobacteria bacterium]
MQTEPETSIILRTPTPDDGASVFNLISQCPPLDTNSMYCNLIQCSHFANTSAAAVINEKLMGFISGYLIPQRPDTLFIWQVVVGEQA